MPSLVRPCLWSGLLTREQMLNVAAKTGIALTLPTRRGQSATGWYPVSAFHVVGNRWRVTCSEHKSDTGKRLWLYEILK